MLPSSSRNAICPSHYMGAEIYRETGDEKYLTLAKGLIAIRDSVTNGEDHNQDRHKFRDQYEAMGHAVRANYLYAGVADLYAETGERQLMKNLSAIWDDIVNHKIYIMGGCGALYDGVSPDGTTYNQPSIQQIHQAYGRQFQLPQEAAHNEICAQIGMLLFSWRMFQTTVRSEIRRQHRDRAIQRYSQRYLTRRKRLLLHRGPASYQRVSLCHALAQASSALHHLFLLSS